MILMGQSQHPHISVCKAYRCLSALCRYSIFSFKIIEFLISDSYILGLSIQTILKCLINYRTYVQESHHKWNGITSGADNLCQFFKSVPWFQVSPLRPLQAWGVQVQSFCHCDGSCGQNRCKSRLKCPELDLQKSVVTFKNVTHGTVG